MSDETNNPPVVPAVPPEPPATVVATPTQAEVDAANAEAQRLAAVATSEATSAVALTQRAKAEVEAVKAELQAAKATAQDEITRRLEALEQERRDELAVMRAERLREYLAKILKPDASAADIALLCGDADPKTEEGRSKIAALRDRLPHVFVPSETKEQKIRTATLGVPDVEPPAKGKPSLWGNDYRTKVIRDNYGAKR